MNLPNIKHHWLYRMSHGWGVTTNQLRTQMSSEFTNALDRQQSGEVFC
ncbi:rCG27533 [Rattus norvegicus]|uniref:RCG27533 n=1 Tax=Rattus norvegicus TaxID=10116 RepID=A6K756_RAT|nr:rCG27533 [Rattus norvegicus]